LHPPLLFSLPLPLFSVLLIFTHTHSLSASLACLPKVPLRKSFLSSSSFSLFSSSSSPDVSKGDPGGTHSHPGGFILLCPSLSPPLWGVCSHDFLCTKVQSLVLSCLRLSAPTP